MAKRSLSCPRDGALLQPTVYEGFEIDSCKRCGGSWLDKGELEGIQRAPGVGAPSAETAPPAAASLAHDRAAAPREAIACPACKGETEAREHGFASQILVDSCLAGCGVWVDEGELQALERFYEDNRDNSTLPLHWRLWASVVSLSGKLRGA